MRASTVDSKRLYRFTPRDLSTMPAAIRLQLSSALHTISSLSRQTCNSARRCPHLHVLEKPHTIVDLVPTLECLRQFCVNPDSLPRHHRRLSDPVAVSRCPPVTIKTLTKVSLLRTCSSSSPIPYLSTQSFPQLLVTSSLYLRTGPSPNTSTLSSNASLVLASTADMTCICSTSSAVQGY